jgi:hypothetical protein
MTTMQWVNRVLSALLALVLILGSLLVVSEILVAALGRPPWLAPYPEWSRWLSSHSWNDALVIALAAGAVVLGLLLLVAAFWRGKPAALTLEPRTAGVEVTASRRSVEKSLAAAASRTTGVTGATASVGRRKARVDAQGATRSESDLREEVEAVVSRKLVSLGLADRIRSRVVVRTKEAR